MARKPALNKGFTLIELSIVLGLIAVIMGGGMVVMTSSLQASQYNATVARMDEIEKALLNFSVANNRIPCPTDLTLTVSSANYGFEAGAGSGSAIGTATGVCTGTGMLPQANFKAASGTVEGGVPTRALQLPDDYMYDGWGRKFRYAVDPSKTASSALPAAVYSPCGVSSTGITVNDASGAARTTAAAYALISHGANGHGAYTSNGVVLNAGSVNANELVNCHCNSIGVATTYTPTYIEQAPSTDSTNALDNFDDIVTFKEPWQLQALNYPLSQTAAQCVYVTDSGNYRVEQFNSKGVYQSQIGCASGACASGSGNGQFSYPDGIAVDGSGNIYVTDTYNYRVEKFNSSGVYQSQIGCASGACASGSGNGQFTLPTGIAIDAGGNIWVVDFSSNRVEKFNSSGVYQSQLGCASGACSTGSGNGQFNFPEGIAIDSSGNIWVTDYDNYRVEEFNSSGAYLSQIGCASGACSSGSGNGQFSSPFGIAADAGGNIWVTDYINNRVEKFNSSGTFLLGIGSGYQGVGGSIGSSGSGNGQLYYPQDVAIDSSGNAWVTDTGNNRFEEFNSSGAYLSQFGSSGSGNGHFEDMLDITVGR